MPSDKLSTKVSDALTKVSPKFSLSCSSVTPLDANFSFNVEGLDLALAISFSASSCNCKPFAPFASATESLTVSSASFFFMFKISMFILYCLSAATNSAADAALDRSITLCLSAAKVPKFNLSFSAAVFIALLFASRSRLN